MPSKEELLALIDTTVEETTSWVDDVLQKLGWSKDYLFQKDIELVSCPVNPGHKMPRSSLDAHMKYCPLLSKGYTKEELDAICDTDFCYENSNVVVKVTIDENEFQEIMRKTAETHGGLATEIVEMPVTIDRAEKVLSREQRLALHEYFIEKAKSIRPKAILSAEDLMLLDEVKKDDSSEPKSHLAFLKMQRDLKRRRQSYRAKNVHITKKNYTEVLREVIENQMEAWVAVTTEHKESERRTPRDQDVERRSQDVDRRSQDIERRSQDVERRSQDRRDRSRSPQAGRHGYRKEESSSRSRRRSRSRSQERHSRRNSESRSSRSKRSRDRSSAREENLQKRHRKESRSRSRSRGRHNDERNRHRDESKECSQSSRAEDQEKHESESEERSSKKHKKHKKHKHKKKDR